MNAGPIDQPPLAVPRGLVDHEFTRATPSAGPVPTAHPSSDAWPATQPGAEREPEGTQ
jgi:hypothetical protein